jgi:hypothetical protein
MSAIPWSSVFLIGGLLEEISSYLLPGGLVHLPPVLAADRIFTANSRPG